VNLKRIDKVAVAIGRLEVSAQHVTDTLLGAAKFASTLLDGHAQPEKHVDNGCVVRLFGVWSSYFDNHFFPTFFFR
jgi:hypothetical protein